jgi:hypothetical protein
MNTRRLAAGAMIVILLGDVVATQAPAGKEKPDSERIVGIWRITKGVGGGMELPADGTALGRLHFTKDGKSFMIIVDKTTAPRG